MLIGKHIGVSIVVEIRIDQRLDEKTVVCRVRWAKPNHEVVSVRVVIPATPEEAPKGEPPTSTIRKQAIIQAQSLAREFGELDFDHA